ncbi:MAG: hypothetical protein KDK64_03705 [Chlamydiia bacterium]|nr:hypothetical protein [Chlamydiia bacterium]
MKKILFLAVFSLPLLAHTLSDRVEQLEAEMKSIYVENPMGTGGAQFGEGSPAFQGSRWFLTADILYWHAKAGGTEYAITLNSSDFPQKGNVKDCDFSWDFGFRFGIGHFLGNQDWDLYLNYTHYDTSDTESTHELVDSPNPGGGNFRGISHAKFNAVIDHNALDLTLGKHYFISQKLSFHPFIGVKSAWLDQKYKYQGNDDINALQTAFAIAGRVHNKVVSKCDWWGIGPKFGMDSEWFLGDGFRLFANLSGALFYSYCDVSFNQKVFFTPVGSPQTSARARLHGDKHQFTPQVAFCGGLSWGTDLHLKNANQYIELGLGYEVQYFWRANQTLDISDTSPALTGVGPIRLDYGRTSEDIMFYGITFNIRFDF